MSLSLSTYIYVNIYKYIYVYMCIYTYVCLRAALVHVRRPPRPSTQGPSWGYSKVNFEIFFRKRWQFSPNVDKNEEMAPRTRTGHPYEGPFAASQLATEREFFMDNLPVRIRFIVAIILADRPRAKGVSNSNSHSASYLPS